MRDNLYLCLECPVAYFDAHQSELLTFVHEDDRKRMLSVLRVREPLVMRQPDGVELALKPGDVLLRDAEGRVSGVDRASFEAHYLRASESGHVFSLLPTDAEAVQFMCVPKTEKAHRNDLVYLMDLRVGKIADAFVVQAFKGEIPLDKRDLDRLVMDALFAGRGGKHACALMTETQGIEDMVLHAFCRSFADICDGGNNPDFAAMGPYAREQMLASWAGIAELQLYPLVKGKLSKKHRALIQDMTGGSQLLRDALGKALNRDLGQVSVEDAGLLPPPRRLDGDDFLLPQDMYAFVEKAPKTWFLGRTSDGVPLVDADAFCQAYEDYATPVIFAMDNRGASKENEADTYVPSFAKGAEAKKKEAETEDDPKAKLRKLQDNLINNIIKKMPRNMIQKILTGGAFSEEWAEANGLFAGMDEKLKIELLGKIRQKLQDEFIKNMGNMANRTHLGVRVVEDVAFINDQGQEQRLAAGGMFLIPFAGPAKAVGPRELREGYARADDDVQLMDFVKTPRWQAGFLRACNPPAYIFDAHMRDIELIKETNLIMAADNAIAASLISGRKGLPVAAIRKAVQEDRRVKDYGMDPARIDMAIAKRVVRVMAHQGLRHQFLSRPSAVRRKLFADWSRLLQDVFGPMMRSKSKKARMAFASEFCKGDPLLAPVVINALVLRTPKPVAAKLAPDQRCR